MPEKKESAQNRNAPENLFQEVENDLEKSVVTHLESRLKEEMVDYPGLSDYVSSNIKEGLTPQEERLIGEASLVTFQYCQRNNIKLEPGEEGEKNLDISDLPTLAIVLDDDYLSKDKNKIYVDLKEDLEEHPELAEFLARMMQKSVSLEEANLIGRTALVVYRIRRFPFDREQETRKT